MRVLDREARKPDCVPGLPLFPKFGRGKPEFAKFEVVAVLIRCIWSVVRNLSEMLMVGFEKGSSPEEGEESVGKG